MPLKSMVLYRGELCPLFQLFPSNKFNTGDSNISNIDYLDCKSRVELFCVVSFFSNIKSQAEDQWEREGKIKRNNQGRNHLSGEIWVRWRVKEAGRYRKAFPVFRSCRGDGSCTKGGQRMVRFWEEARCVERDDWFQRGDFMFVCTFWVTLH